MAEILPFATSTPKRARRRHEGVGEVVIFPGIRVEYHDSLPTPPTKRRPRRSKRGGDDALSA